MASTRGFVQTVKQVDPDVAFVAIGATPTNTDLFYLIFDNADGVSLRTLKRAMLSLLSTCQHTGLEAQVHHDQGSSEIKGVGCGPFDLSPLGRAVHDDLYSVSGTAIPNDAELVFDSVAATVRVTPDFVRPHMLLVMRLPSLIPVGRNRLRIESNTWTSAWFPVEVSTGPAQTIRVLYSGDPKPSPYTVALIGNGAIEQAGGGAFYADPILTNRADYNTAVVDYVDNLVNVTEDLLRLGSRDARYRLVSIFDAGLTAAAADALCHEIAPNLMETRRDNFADFALRYGERLDIGVAIHGSTVFNRATAWFSTDDANRPGTAFTFDGTAYQHRHFVSVAGTVAIWEGFDRTGLTPIHELGHAASDFNNGRVLDLYVDGAAIAQLVVNKKWRALATDPIPAVFASYNGNNYQSDQNRDGLGYPAAWRSYHPQQLDATVPNLMDNYWLALNPQTCRFDALTYDWLDDRLAAKLSR